MSKDLLDGIMADAVDKSKELAAAYAQQGRDAAGAATTMLSERLSGVAAAVRHTTHHTHPPQPDCWLQLRQPCLHTALALG